MVEKIVAREALKNRSEERAHAKLEPKTLAVQPPRCPQCGSVMQAMQLPDNIDRRVHRTEEGEIVSTAIITEVLVCSNCRLAVIQAESKPRAN